MSDAALLLQARGGDELAFRRLLVRYGNLLDCRLRKYYRAAGLEQADLYQEALVGLSKAVADYRPGHGAGFPHFASICIDRQLATAVKTATRKKHEVLNGSTHLHQPVAKGAESLTLADVIPAGAHSDPHQRIHDQEDLEEIASVLADGLSDLERKAILGRADGLEYEQIAERQGVSKKAVDNALQRADRKLSQALEPVAA